MVSAYNTLRTHPGFIAIETEHKNMHRLAANLLQTAASGATIASLDFDRFVNISGIPGRLNSYDKSKHAGVRQNLTTREKSGSFVAKF